MDTAATPPAPFLVDHTGDPTAAPDAMEARAVEAEAAGYDGFLVAETRHDPFVSLGVVARATRRVTLMSGIVVAFARSPMTTAVAANDIQLMSGGRFVLGLGSQVKPHIERRFGMPWSRPAARMEDYVHALHAIWESWDTGGPLRHRGEFYEHTLMTPFFSPGPNPHGHPAIHLAAVGERMTEAAGRVADGLVAHTFTTPGYLREVTLPALARGRADSARAADPAPVVDLLAFVALGESRAELDAAVAGTRKQLAFYASTPSYLPVLAHHGWEPLHERLHAMSRRGEWDEMADAVDDDVLAAFVVVGTPQEAAAELTSRFAGLVDRLSFSTPYAAAPALTARLAAALRPAARPETGGAGAPDLRRP